MNFWKSVFSEPTGEPSFSRVATGLIVLGSVGWTTIIVVRLAQFPDFAGLCALIGTLYGINRISSVFAGRQNGQKS